MICPLCGQRRTRRACPALGHDICAVCCGTKRLTEIRCPPDCAYLQSSRAHPPAVVRRQQERDLRFFLPIVHDLTEVQSRVLTALLAQVRRHRPGAIPSIQDIDVAAAAGALAATLETADRGIIYEHQPASLPAQHLAAELKTFLDRLAEGAPPSVARDIGAALRRLERCAQEAPGALGGPDAFLQLLDRLATLEGPEEAGGPADAGGQAPPPTLIVP